MRLSLKYLKLNEYTLNHDEVPEGTQYGFWRIVEHTGAGWFPWDGLYSDYTRAEKIMNAILEAENKKNA